MAVLQVQETDTAAACATAAFCSGLSVASTPAANRVASVGGTAGVTAQTITLAAGTTAVVAAAYEIVPLNVIIGPGTWVVRINVTTASSRSSTWASTFVCNVSGNCLNSSVVASLSGQAIALGTTGVKTMTVTGGTGFTFVSGNRIEIALGFANGSTTKTDTIGLTPNQLIDTTFWQDDSMDTDRYNPNVQDIVTVTSVWG